MNSLIPASGVFVYLKPCLHCTHPECWLQEIFIEGSSIKWVAERQGGLLSSLPGVLPRGVDKGKAIITPLGFVSKISLRVGAFIVLRAGSTEGSIIYSVILKETS